MKARIEKLEKRIPPNEPTGSAGFLEFCDESGNKKLVHASKDHPPASEDDIRSAEQQGRQVVIFHFPPGTVFKPPRKPPTTT
ncbi:hypothetical protein ACFLUJ_02060 [Chloroflexota bacterium]